MICLLYVAMTIETVALKMIFYKYTMINIQRAQQTIRILILLLDNKQSYGLVSKINHWLSAFIVIGLYFLGRWMIDLDYYSSWYVDAPNLHKSLGILLALFTVFRLLWKFLTPSPAAPLGHAKHLILISRIAHYMMYIALFIIFISGYLISTADGRAIAIFQLLSIPALPAIADNQADLAGVIHEYATDMLMLMVVLHLLAALKHHFIDKDNTLLRLIK